MATGVDLVWAPAMSAADWYRAAWTHRPEERPELLRLFAPVQRELWRRREAFEAARAGAAAALAGPGPGGFEVSKSVNHPVAPAVPSSSPPVVPRTKAEAQSSWGELLQRLARSRRLKG